ncbi:hypothetical protein GWN26_01245, partial [Candidatus Saccharibacteria bacterium]|nr:hypothetical protein [Candidatus Saccharibacteria bacterium]NIW78163.1 hypothetical protein [Calditrichia bacterium]
MKMTYYRLVVFIAGMLISCSILADARTDINFTRTPYIDEELKLHVEVDLLNRSHFPVQDVRIYYREYSEPRFQSARMAMEGLRYLASVNLSDYKGSMVEYFVNVEYADGSFQSYPAEAPESNLMKVSVAQDFDSGDGILVISPEPGEDILTDEFILTVSFFQYSASVDGERTKLYLDDWDVSRYVKVFDDFLTFAPKRVPQGSHAIRLELYDKTGRLLARKKWSFSAYQRRGPAPTAPRDQLNINGQLYAESRTEELVDGAVSNQYTRTGLRLNAAYQDFSFGTRLFLSNQEDENLQPINRYSGWAQYNFWTDRFIKVTGGDAYPQLNPFLLSNIFIRGVYGQVYLKFLNIDAVTGQTRRGIEGSQTITGPDTSIIAGAFERDIWGIRTSFGGRKNFQFGIMAMKGRD